MINMKTLIIYDNTGYIFITMSGAYTVPQGGVNYLEIEISANKRVTSIDTNVKPNIPIYEDIQLSETEILQNRIAEQETALIELAEMIGGMV
jgi:hypothetical protein